ATASATTCSSACVTYRWGTGSGAGSNWAASEPAWPLNSYRLNGLVGIAGTKDEMSYIAIRQDHTVVGWGQNSYGTVGNGAGSLYAWVRWPVKVPYLTH